MTRNHIQQMVDELAGDLRTHVFQALDAEIWINGDEAGRVASTIERAMLAVTSISLRWQVRDCLSDAPCETDRTH
jgi:hypothetical protein